MSAEELLEKLVERLGKTAAAQPPLPVQYDAWDTEHIARYLKRSADFVRREILVQPGFPRPMRLPTAGRAQPLYKAREVVAWAEAFTS